MLRGNFTLKAKLLLYLLFMMLLTVNLPLKTKATSFFVTISGKNVPLEYLFTEITTQTGLLFVFDTAELKIAHKIDLNFINAKVEQVLDHCFHSQPLYYKMYKANNIVVVGLKKGGVNVMQADPLRKYPSASLVKNIEVMLTLFLVFISGLLIFHKSPVKKSRASILMALGLGYNFKEITRHFKHRKLFPSRIAHYFERKLQALQQDLDAISCIKENKLYKWICFAKKVVYFLFFIYYLILFIIWLKGLGSIIFMSGTH